MQEHAQDLLSEIEETVDVTPVSAGTRFAHYIVDIICYYAIFGLFAFMLGLMIGAGSGDTDESGGAYLLFFIISYFGYYILMEGLCNGRTVGKMVTGSQVLKTDGSPITIGDATMRTFCRLIPFEPFSAFGAIPWHDSISNTVVTKKVR